MSNVEVPGFLDINGRKASTEAASSRNCTRSVGFGVLATPIWQSNTFTTDADLSSLDLII